MREVIFSKFCCHRKKKYQIRTTITQEDGCKRVSKKALYSSGIAHMESIVKNRYLLKELYKKSDCEICGCYQKDNEEVLFDFIEGVHFDSLMEQVFEEGDMVEMLKHLKDFYALLQPMVTNDVWENTDQFHEVFGHILPDKKSASGNICNIDMIFSNIIKADRYYITDYEWVFEFPIPVNYIFYRSLLLSSGFSKLQATEQEKIWECFGIDQKQRQIYLKMEQNLQAYIVGGEFSVRSVNERNPYEAVNIKDILWEEQGYTIRVYGVKDNKKVEIYTKGFSGENGKINVHIQGKLEYSGFEICLVPCYSIIIIESITGTINGTEKILDYKHNATLQINNVLYFTEEIPVIYVENVHFETFTIECQIVKRNDSIVKQVVEYIQERQQFKDQAEQYKSQAEQYNDQADQFKDQVEQLECINASLRKEKENLQKEYEHLKNLKAVRFYMKLKGIE